MVELCFATVISTQITSSSCNFQIVAVVELCFATVISTQITSSRWFFKVFLQEVFSRCFYKMVLVAELCSSSWFRAEFYSKKAVIASREQLLDKLGWKQLPEYDVRNGRLQLVYNLLTAESRGQLCLWLANRWRFQTCKFKVRTGWQQNLVDGYVFD